MSPEKAKQMASQFLSELWTRMATGKLFMSQYSRKAGNGTSRRSLAESRFPASSTRSTSYPAPYSTPASSMPTASYISQQSTKTTSFAASNRRSWNGSFAHSSKSRSPRPQTLVNKSAFTPYARSSCATTCPQCSRRPTTYQGTGPSYCESSERTNPYTSCDSMKVWNGRPL